MVARNVATKLRMHDVCSDLRTSSTIGRFDDQSMVVRNVATKLRVHIVCSDLQTSLTFD